MSEDRGVMPECDYCGVVPSYEPWHGSGFIDGCLSRHIHACDDCRHLLPGFVDVPVPLMKEQIKDAIGFEFEQGELQMVNATELITVYMAGVKHATVAFTNVED